MTPLTEKQKFNLKALGLGIYLYILAWFSMFIVAAFFQGLSPQEIISDVILAISIYATKGILFYLPIQFILYLIARRILKKNPRKSVLKFIYISFLVIVSFLILIQVFPPEGIRLIG